MNASIRRRTLTSVTRHSAAATRSISCFIPPSTATSTNGIIRDNSCCATKASSLATNYKFSIPYGQTMQIRDFSNQKRSNDKSKKKQFFSSPKPPVYGTPDTGLILPPKGVVLQEEPQEDNAAFMSNSSSRKNTSQMFSPLMDHGTSASESNNAEADTDALHINSFENMEWSLSSQQLSAPNMIDFSSMYDPRIHLPLKPDFADPSKNYEAATPLGEELMKYIGVLGAPITLAEYMKRCLRDVAHGYYTNPPQGRDDFDDDIDMDMDESNSEEQGRGHRLIGQAGDFTTAPEISQIFGECLTIWLLTQYESLGRPSKIQLVELGPGRGTLMSDILRSAKGIEGPGQEFIEALKCGDSDSESGSVVEGKGEDGSVQGVHFVEVSDNLRITQREALQKLQNSNDADSMLSFNFIQWKTKGEKMEEMQDLMSKMREKKSKGEELDTETLAKLIEEQRQAKYGPTASDQIEKANAIAIANHSSSIPIHWHDSFDAVPSQNGKDCRSIPTFIIGQEFVDALPVHVFQKTEHGWREHMVDVALEDDDDEDNTVEVQMRDGSTAKTKAPASISAKVKSTSNDEQKKKTRFRHVLSPGVTPALRNLLHIDDNGTPSGTPTQVKALNDAPIGTIMEVCPEGLALIQDLALRIEECKGAALVIDYGNEGSRDTLRAFRKHEQVDILSSPGTVDVTADVDFGALKNAVNHDLQMSRKKMNEGNEKTNALPHAFGPTTQGQFLASMGAVERTIKLIEDDSTTDEQADDLCTALERLVSEEEMGQRFKVLAIAHKKEGIFSPPGF